MDLFFQDNQSDQLILVLNGWGMDERPFLPILPTDKDILVLSNYNNLDFDFDFTKYEKKYLICFSAGVMMAGILKEKLPEFKKSVAVCGSFHIFENQKGLPAEIYEEISNLTMDNALGFREKLICEKSQLELFNENQPHRSLESSLNEFENLQIFAKATAHFEFDSIIIGENDKILPLENQLRAWGENKNTRVVKGGHFLFYNFKSIDDLLN